MGKDTSFRAGRSLLESPMAANFPSGILICLDIFFMAKPLLTPNRFTSSKFLCEKLTLSLLAN
ncbi:hypothetical protein FACS1894152_6500 [Bacilli bacterium]|nr:hypothetical protein FACS1894152_6500 [Bacilli bacterium]